MTQPLHPINTRVLVVLWVLAIIFEPPSLVGAHEHSGDRPPDAKLGSVSFETSCKRELQGNFNRAVALLHSFWHSEAQIVFESVAADDPDCAMAYWGIAMSHLHLGLSWPSSRDLRAGRAALYTANEASEKTPREAAYLSALVTFVDEFEPDHSPKIFQRYATALGKIAKTYPTDLEAQVFEALAWIMAQQPEDTDLIEMRRAVAILTPLLPQYPDHPGIAHYLIHACDSPGLAQEGLDAARRYAQIAPAAPHALHMPSHIFTRLGLWQEDITSNLASAAAAETAHAGAENRLHALEFLEYAYLQIGHDDEAEQMLKEAQSIPQSEVDVRYRASYYPIAQTQFRTIYAIETHDWAAAARIEPSPSNEDEPRFLALLAHAMAAGHLKDRTLARTTLEEAESVVRRRSKDPRLPAAGTPGADFLDQIRSWAAFTNGDINGAVKLLHPVADRQALVGKGELDLPVREMLADMLLADGKNQEALDEYQLSLKSDPNRFNALLGAAKAAERLGRRDRAIAYYQALLSNCIGATGHATKELEHARTLMHAQITNHW